MTLRSRSSAFGLLALGLSMGLGAGGAALADPITLTDVAGRTVTLQGPARRIALAEARQIPALSIVAADFDRRLVGLGALNRFDEALQSGYFARFPALAAVAEIDGDRLPSAEKIIAVGADLLVLSGGAGSVANASALADTLASAGIATLFVDFRADPWANTVPSIRALGAALGESARAEAFASFIEAHRRRVLDRIAQADPPRPGVLLQLQAQVDGPLISPGAGGAGAFVEAAGGRNIGADIVPGMFGPLSPEFVLTEDPEVWIGTGGAHFVTGRGIVAGPGVSAADAEASLRAFVAAEPVIGALGAARTGRVYGLWHNYLNTSLNIVALEEMAVWLHPELFADLSPAATLDEINRRFLPVPVTGALTVRLTAPPPESRR